MQRHLLRGMRYQTGALSQYWLGPAYFALWPTTWSNGDRIAAAITAELGAPAKSCAAVHVDMPVAILRDDFRLDLTDSVRRQLHLVRTCERLKPGRTQTLIVCRRHNYSASGVASNRKSRTSYDADLARDNLLCPTPSTSPRSATRVSGGLGEPHP